MIPELFKSDLKRKHAVFLIMALLLSLSFFVPQITSNSTKQVLPGSSKAASKAEKERVLKAYGKLPIYFIPNKGQINSKVKYYATGAGYSFFLTNDGVTYSFVKEKEAKSRKTPDLLDKEKAVGPQNEQLKQEGYALKVEFAGANPAIKIEGLNKKSAKINYFLGKGKSNWKTDISTYGQATYRNLYPGIDLTYKGKGGKLKYEFIIQPKANPGKIKLLYKGAKFLKTDRAGNLLIGTPWGTLKDEKPVVYQAIGKKKTEVKARFNINQARVGFTLGHYDKNLPLVIDPGLVYSTFLGGSTYENGTSIALDSSGNAYVAGASDSSNFPTTAGVYDTSHNGNRDVFVAKLNATGSDLLYSTFLGGLDYDVASSIALDSSGNAYVTGYARFGFPTTAGAYDTSHNGFSDVFVTKLNTTGSDLVYSTFLGGSSFDWAYSLSLDASGNAYVTGSTESSNFPTTAGAYDTSHNGGTDDVFVARLNTTGSGLNYSTFLGGNAGDWAYSLTLDASGNTYVTGASDSSNFPTTAGAYDTSYNSGRDIFVTKLNTAGSGLNYSTFLGGSGLDIAYSIAQDASGNAYVTGTTVSSDFPTTAGAYDTSYNGGDVFVTKLNTTGSGLNYSTFLGGSAGDEAYSLTLDASGNAYVTGASNSSGFPTTTGAFDASLGGIWDAFVTQLNTTGSDLVYSTFLGGSSAWEYGYGIAVDPSGNAYITGYTESSNFPTTAGAYDTGHNGQQDAFVTKLDLTPDTIPPITSLSTSPASPDGTNGWFKTTPSISLTRDEPGTTYYSWTSSTGPWTTYSGSFNAPEGGNTLYYYSVDTAGNAETVKSELFKVDTQPPDNFIQNLPADGATVNKPYPYFSWSASADTGSGLAKYQLYVDGLLARDNITNWTSAVPSASLANGYHTWFVKVLDQAGNYRDSANRNLTVDSGPGKIAFASNRDGVNFEVYTMDAGGSGQTRLTTNFAYDFEPSFSPDGNKITYISDRDGDIEVYVMNADGTGEMRLTNSPGWDYWPSFSPDGSKIIFSSERDGNYELYVMNIDGTNLARLTFNLYSDLNPRFSPDGSKIVFSSNRVSGFGIYLMNADGTGETALTNNSAYNYRPSFSDDGSKIVFTSDYDGNFEIYLMNADGTGMTRLTNNAASDREPSFSPGGNEIAFASDRDGDGEIYLMNIDGSNQVGITNNAADDSAPFWGPSAPLPADTTPPVTSLSTNPSSSDGTNGWFMTTPSITLTRDEPGTTYYSWTSSTGPWATYSTSFNAPEGQNTLYYYSVDIAGNAEAVKSQAFKVDTQRPASFLQNLPADGATVNKPYPYFSWNASADTGSGLAKYQLYIDGSLARDNILNWTSAIPSSALANGSHNWFVRAWDNAGNYGDSLTGNFTVDSGPGKIVFSRDGLFIMNADGSDLTRLTNNPDEGAAFSPDGNRIVFHDSAGSNIYIMNVDGTNKTRLTGGTTPAWSPDGSKVVFASNIGGDPEIYIMDSDGNNQVELTSYPSDDFRPVFSPDGSIIVFVSNRGGYYEIFQMNIDGSNQVNLTNSPTFNAQPTFSPDGTKIIFASSRESLDLEIYEMDANGSNQRNLTNSSSDDRSPTFSPDGNKIAYESSAAGDNSDIYVMNANGSNTVNITNNSLVDNRLPNWGPSAPLPADTTPPTTAVSTNPPSPDGTSGWFKTTPSIILSANEPGTTYFSWNSATGPWTTYSAPFNAPEGENTLYYYSADDAGNSETAKSQLFTVDTTPPASFLLDIPADGSTVNKPYPYFSWNIEGDTNSGLDKYQLYIDGSLARDNIVNLTSAVPSAALSNSSHTWFVRAWDQAGNYRDSLTRNLTVDSGLGKIAFTSSRDGNEEIYVMNANGSNQIRLTNNPASDQMASFSSNGSKIAFASNRDGGEGEIYVMNSDGSNQLNLTNNPASDWVPSFSPEGSKIAFNSHRGGNEEIYVMNADGSAQTNLTNHPALDGWSSYSPDGSKIAFHSTRDGGVGVEIYVMNADGSGQTRLTNNLLDEYYPSFSPDGSKIIFESWRDGNAEIYLMNINGSNQTRLTNNPAFDRVPSFSSDGSKIVFNSNRDGNNEIYVMNADGSGQTRLTNTPAGDFHGDWGPSTSLSSDTTPPSVPTLSGSAISSTQINLSWTTSIDTESGVAGYNIYNAVTNALLATTTATNRTFYGLTPGAIYQYYVRAYDLAGNLSTVSNTVTVTTPSVADTTPPSAPKVVGFAPSTSEINLYWVASTDNVGVAGYRVYDADTGAFVGSTDECYYLLSGLNSGTLYSYYVRAYDAAGNLSSASETVRIDPGGGGNTPTDSGAERTVNPHPNVSVTFTEVTADGETTAITSSTPVSGPPTGFKFRGYEYNIQTTASYTSPVLVSIRYDPSDIQGNEASLKLFHWEDNRWKDVTLYVDTENNVILGQVNTLSPFILGNPVPPSAPTGLNTYWLVITSLFMMIGGWYLLWLRKRKLVESGC